MPQTALHTAGDKQLEDPSLAAAESEEGPDEALEVPCLLFPVKIQGESGVQLDAQVASGGDGLN